MDVLNQSGSKSLSIKSVFLIVLVAVVIVILIIALMFSKQYSIIPPQDVNLIELNIPSNGVSINFVNSSIIIDKNTTIEVQTQGNLTLVSNGIIMPTPGSYHYLIDGVQDPTIYIQKGVFVEFIVVNVNKQGYNDFAITNNITRYMNNINSTKTIPPEYMSADVPPPDLSNPNAPVYYYSYVLFNATNPGTYYYFSTVYPDLFYGMQGIIEVEG